MMRSLPSKHFLQLRRKYLAQSGDTIVEALVAILVASLSMLMLVGAVSIATSLTTSSRDRLDSYYQESAYLEGLISKSGSTTSATVKSDSVSGESTQISDVTYEVTKYKSEILSGSGVVSYEAKS